MKTDQIIIISSFIAMAVQIIGFGIFLRRNNLSIGGVPPINKTLFKTAKTAMMLIWLSLFIQAIGSVDLSFFDTPDFLRNMAAGLTAAGMFIQFISYLYLGKNLKFGIPDTNEKKTATLKTNGIYRFSRNPMYVGFYLLRKKELKIMN